MNAFVTHAVFPKESWRRFATGGDRKCFDRFWVTDSIKTVEGQLPPNDVFEVLPLTKLIVHDLDHHITGNVKDYPDLGV